MATLDCAPRFWRLKLKTCPRKTSSGPFSAAPANWKASTTKRSRSRVRPRRRCRYRGRNHGQSKPRRQRNSSCVFEKRGNLGESGSVRFMFSKKGLIAVEKTAATEDQLMDMCSSTAAKTSTTKATLGDHHHPAPTRRLPRPSRLRAFLP